jgi:hypothetical protein
MITVFVISPWPQLPPTSYPGATIVPLGRSMLGYGYRLEFPVSAPARQ